MLTCLITLLLLALSHLPRNHYGERSIVETEDKDEEVEKVYRQIVVTLTFPVIDISISLNHSPYTGEDPLMFPIGVLATI